MILHGDCLEVLKTLEDNSVDSIVTDPPYELGFMGKSWDNTGIAYNVEMWRECLRVLKHGGHLLAFGGTRTYHRMACAIEDAGFEIRDMIEWVYGSGFPKSLNIGKAVDKLQGNEREVVGNSRAGSKERNGFKGDMAIMPFETKTIDLDITKGTSEWEGWGTSLKPAHEPICMARKPLAEKTVAENVLKYGTGGINIDESRVESSQEDKEIMDKNASKNPTTNYSDKEDEIYSSFAEDKAVPSNPIGRYPANLIHDNSEEVRECFPDTNKSVASKRGANRNGDIYGKYNPCDTVRGHDDNGGNASCFFKSTIYQAKASKRERGDGNNHPTVKPIALMEYLIKMVTPKGGVVLDPFAGSGTTLVSAKQNGFSYIGIEMTAEYIDIINARLNDVKIENDETCNVSLKKVDKNKKLKVIKLEF